MTIPLPTEIVDVNVGTVVGSAITYICDMTNSLVQPTAVNIVVGSNTYATASGTASFTKQTTAQTTAEKAVASLAADTTYKCQFVFGTINTVEKSGNLAELLCKFGYEVSPIIAY